MRPAKTLVEQISQHAHSEIVNMLPAAQRRSPVRGHPAVREAGEVALTVVLDGKPHALRVNRGERVVISDDER